jgi:hypothetical protein
VILWDKQGLPAGENPNAGRIKKVKNFSKYHRLNNDDEGRMAVVVIVVVVVVVRSIFFWGFLTQARRRFEAST